MTIQDKQGNSYYDAAEAMERIGIRSRETLLRLVKSHNLKRYGFKPSRKVFYSAEDIDYLCNEEGEDVYELPPLKRQSIAS